VKDYIGRENGMIKIRFTDTNVGADFRQFEMIVCLPKVLSENVEGFNFRSQDELEDALVEFKSEETVSFKQA
jgi:two-component system chemotaxis sensor kinase CheA